MKIEFSPTRWSAFDVSMQDMVERANRLNVAKSRRIRWYSGCLVWHLRSAILNCCRKVGGVRARRANCLFEVPGGAVFLDVLGDVKAAVEKCLLQLSEERLGQVREMERLFHGEVERILAAVDAVDPKVTSRRTKRVVQRRGVLAQAGRRAVPRR